VSLSFNALQAGNTGIDKTFNSHQGKLCSWFHVAGRRNFYTPLAEYQECSAVNERTENRFLVASLLGMTQTGGVA
jgi:hypothetical protein